MGRSGTPDVYKGDAFLAFGSYEETFLCVNLVWVTVLMIKI